jgi:hypothetical protein
MDARESNRAVINASPIFGRTKVVAAGKSLYQQRDALEA